MKEYTLPGELVTSLETFWIVVGHTINGPGGYFGRNLDAFSDCLSGGFGTPEEGFVLRWRQSEHSKQALGYRETARVLQDRLTRCHPSNRDRVQAELAQAEAGRGLTVFDTLVSIIRDEPTVTLILE